MPCRFIYSTSLGLFQKLSSGGSGPQALFGGFFWGGGVLLTCPRDGGSWLVLGVKVYLIHSGAGLIKALTCPEGRRGALTQCVSWGWRGLQKNVSHPHVRTISGTALRQRLQEGKLWFQIFAFLIAATPSRGKAVSYRCLGFTDDSKAHSGFSTVTFPIPNAPRVNVRSSSVLPRTFHTSSWSYEIFYGAVLGPRTAV